MAAKKKATASKPRKSAVRRSQDTLIAAHGAWLDRETQKRNDEERRNAKRIGGGLDGIKKVVYTAYTKWPGGTLRRSTRSKTSPAQMQKFTCNTLAMGAVSVVWVPNDGSTELSFACKKKR